MWLVFVGEIVFIRVVTVRNNVVDKYKIVTQKNVNINTCVVVEVTVPT